MDMDRTARPAQILVVEDDEAIREVLTEILQDAGYKVRNAEHGGRALEVLGRGFAPDVILLDLMMPVMDGWALLGELEQAEGYSGIPVITISAVRGAVHRHARFVLSKPLDIDALLEAVEGCRCNRRGGAHARAEGAAGGLTRAAAP